MSDLYSLPLECYLNPGGVNMDCLKRIKHLAFYYTFLDKHYKINIGNQQLIPYTQRSRITLYYLNNLPLCSKTKKTLRKSAINSKVKSL